MLLILQGTEQYVITKRKIIQNSVVLRIETLQYSCVFANKFLSLWMSKSKHTLPSHSKLNIWTFYGQACSQTMCSFLKFQFSSVQSHSKSYSLPPHGLQQARVPAHHQLPELAQTHVHWVGEAIQPSHPLLSHSPPAFKLPQHQGLFQWVSSLHQVAKLLEFQLQHLSFQWIFSTDFL